MSPIDIGATLDDLLATDPSRLHVEYAGAIAELQAHVAGHRVISGPPLPDVSTLLDEDQQSVIAATARTVRLIAPAGAGKTHCIVNKVVAHLRAGTAPQRLAVVTFDNNSANELRGRCQDLLGPNSPEVSTLNAFGRRLLAKYSWESQGPRLINEAPGYSNQMVKVLLKEACSGRPEVRAVLPTNLKRTYFLQIFSYLKNQLYSPRLPTGHDALQTLAHVLKPILSTSAAPLFAQAGGDKRRFLVLLATVDWLFRRYEAEKEAAGYIDFDDQKLLAYELLQNDQGVRSAVQGSYDYVIVDEFQDLNELDFRLILVVAHTASLLVVGDDDQSIYGFRGTSPAYIINLEELSARPVDTIELRRNYRSPRNIVEHADKLISRNTYRILKSPIATRAEDCDIRVYSALAPSAEASMIGDFIERIVAHQQARYRDIAVLYRLNSQSLPLQLEFVKRAIPYYCRREDNLLGQEYLPRLLSVLRYVADVQASREPALDSFLQLFKAYFRYVDEGLHTKLLWASRRAGPPFLAALDDPVLQGTKVMQSNVVEAIRYLVSARTPLEMLHCLGSRFKGVRGMVGSLEEAANDELPLGELSDVAMQFATQDAFLEFMEESVRRARQGHTEDYDSDAVRLLTYFRSKGAQFDTVILPSLNNGIIPHGKAPIEDERRLFYVAVTRTRRNLWLSYVKRVCNNAVDVSPFLKELSLPSSSWI